MRHYWVLLIVLLGSMAFAAANPDFDRVKSLEGEWEGKDASGTAFDVGYRLISSRTAVMESMKIPEHSDMTTVYYLDGDRLMLTHFCAKDNQPRMKAEPASENGAITFRFLDATNLPDSEAGHMVKLVLNWHDANHFDQEWTYREAGKETREVFALTRRIKQAALEKDFSCTDVLYQVKQVHSPQVYLWNATNREAWESECRVFDHRRTDTKPQKSECTCRKCACK